ncbi:Retrovirus-related Pol polyprotein from type-2 retrotransposable element R2DM [Trichinella pseudospiralis]
MSSCHSRTVVDGGRPEKTSESSDSSGQPFSAGVKRSVHCCRPFNFVCSKCSKEWTSINAVTSRHARYKGGVASAIIPSTTVSPNVCSSCGAAFDTKSGLQLHCKRSHLDIFLQTCNQKTKARWSSDELNLLAKLEAGLHLACKNINQTLQQKLAEFHIARNVEMIKGQRRKATYKVLVLQYQRGQPEETVGSPSGAVSSLPQEASCLPHVDINEPQSKLVCLLAPSGSSRPRGVYDEKSRPPPRATRFNVRVAKYKRFQRLFQNNRRKLASHLLGGTSLEQIKGNIDEATAHLQKTLSCRSLLPAVDDAASLFNIWLKVSTKASRTIFIPKVDGTTEISNPLQCAEWSPIRQGLRVPHEFFICEAYRRPSVHEHVALHTTHRTLHNQGFNLSGPYDNDGQGSVSTAYLRLTVSADMAVLPELYGLSSLTGVAAAEALSSQPQICGSSAAPSAAAPVTALVVVPLHGDRRDARFEHGFTSFFTSIASAKLSVSYFARRRL